MTEPDQADAPRVRLVLTAAIIGAGLLCPFVTEAPNRLITGQGVMLWRLPGNLGFVALAGLVVVCLPLFRIAADWTAWTGRGAGRVVALALDPGIAAVTVIGVVLLAGASADRLTALHPPAVRTGLGAGFWIILLAGGLRLGQAARHPGWAGRAGKAAAVATLLALALLAWRGDLGRLSLAREFGLRQAEWLAELDRHCLLVGASLAIAIPLGGILGLLAYHRPRAGTVILSLLGIVQIIPSVALFGFLILPLTALGFASIGFTPAVIALIAYALLPVARSMVAALQALDPATVETARALGFTPLQRFLHVELPLGAPVLLAGLRYVTVQTIGLAVIAALIGAGGFGTFVFQGIAQYATDLVLLGALSVIAFAVAADFLIGQLRARLAPAGTT